jgi:anti-sigma factor RsiW
MNCSEVQYYGPLYHSGELEEPFLQDFQQHMEACTSCEETIRREQATDNALRLLSDEPVDTTRVREEILVSIQKDLTPKNQYRITWWQGIGGMAALLTVTVVTFLVLRPSAPLPLTIYRDAADDHRAEVVEHMKLRWAQDDASILSLLKTVGATEELTQQITPAGFHLERARVCKLLSHRYVHLVYTDGTREVSYFLRSREGEELTGKPVVTVNGKAVYLDSVRDLSVAGFQTQDVTVLLVSDEPKEQVLATIASAAQRF